MLRVLDLFSGIGGFSLGLERTGGFETVAFCEIEKYPQKVLAKHWPGVPIYDDVRELTARRLATDGIRVDVICGGFPCQDISAAGNQKGIGEGTRSGLWSECARLLGELRPQYAIFENVTALLSGDNGRWFEQVLWDISKVGYDAEWHCIPASELGAHHHRDRVWIIAYPKELQRDGGDNNAREQLEGGEVCKLRDSSGAADVAYPNNNGPLATKVRRSLDAGSDCSEEGQVQTGESAGLCAAGIDENVAHAASVGQEGHRPIRVKESQEPLRKAIITSCISESARKQWKTEPNVGRVADGIPDRSHRLKSLGNAVVPQIPELIGRAILEAEQ